MLLQSKKLGEECGVFGIYSRDDLDVSRLTYFALYALQHRGQESCGMAVNDLGGIVLHKDLGLVADVFDRGFLEKTKGVISVGHVRYSTAGGNTRENAQPLYTKYIKGYFVIAHNGNIANAAELREELEDNGSIFHTTGDTEVISYLLARERRNSNSIEEAVERVVPMLEGSFSLIITSPKKLIAVRDPRGIRPLCLGRIKNSPVLASESCAIDAVGAEFVRDVAPGEILVIDASGERSITKYCGRKSAVCVFEYIYFARPDSVIDRQSVYEARLIAGRTLAKECPVEADMVIGVPDSGICAAIGYAQASGIPYGEGLVKNRYIGRTFIQPVQSMREESVKIKLNVLGRSVCGKRIVMVDDSIVRGTTSAKIIKMIKDAGAKEVHLRISSPPFKWPCFFGTDIPSRKDLAAVRYTQEEIRRMLGADSLGYLSEKALREMLPCLKGGYCEGCFTGEYPIEISKERLV